MIDVIHHLTEYTSPARISVIAFRQPAFVFDPFSLHVAMSVCLAAIEHPHLEGS
jgi:hypothetical protein